MRNTNKGFTLIELMVVVGLIAIMMTLILVNVRKNKVKTRDNIRIADIQSIRLALEEYRAACGVFPATLELDANNTRNNSVDCNFELGDFIPEIPTAPRRENISQVIDNGLASSANVFGGDSTYGGYFYAALSTRPNGPCFEYHLAAELEFAGDNGRDPSNYLMEDHDFVPDDGNFDDACGGSPQDFGGDATSEDDEVGLYDFRSIASDSL